MGLYVVAFLARYSKSRAADPSDPAPFRPWGGDFCRARNRYDSDVLQM